MTTTFHTTNGDIEGGNLPRPGVPATAARWLLEQPDPANGWGRLDRLALEANRSGEDTPERIFAAVTVADSPPQYWGDSTLRATINGLANRIPPPVEQEGPAETLPQWESYHSLKVFRIRAW
nr:hypothetical protein [uncultured Desulfobulbus sp.]